VRSYGTCEVCGKSELCLDVQNFDPRDPDDDHEDPEVDYVEFTKEEFELMYKLADKVMGDVDKATRNIATVGPEQTRAAIREAVRDGIQDTLAWAYEEYHEQEEK
jgi:hypothetical protein